MARRIRRLAGLPGSSPDWPLKLLGELGKIKLLIHAYERIVELSAPLQQDVRQLIGWNVSQQELETSGERVEDQWALYGQWVDDDDRLRTQRTWVVGLNTGRTALILQFAPGTQPFAEQIIPGIVQHATLCFYPGALSLRAKFQERLEAVAPITSRMPGYGSVDEFLDAISTSLAWQPWLGAVGCVLHDVTLSIDGECWYACDHKGEALKLSGRGYWECLAVTGGCPCDLMGEWHGDSLRPLGTLHDGHYRAI